eukprot:TRINITY_DN33510_c0_g1_i1.p1 TRINITY_DN33510_c0_g1~~TRINITY_DN33510_c0_g1_i1.p1  ORF type:complete len:597 (+),score=125.75 TRINITY_DN33510_c0_g1_i1:95-1885(+)
MSSRLLNRLRLGRLSHSVHFLRLRRGELSATSIRWGKRSFASKNSDVAKPSRLQQQKQKQQPTTTGQAEFNPSPRNLQDGEALMFQHLGHVALRGLFSEKEILTLADAVRHAKVSKELNSKRHALRTNMGLSWDDVAKQSPDQVDYLFHECLREGKGITSFLQYFNLWRDSDAIRQTALSLGTVAAGLLNCRRVQLYGDALFVKRPGDNCTDWHADMEHVPLLTGGFLTIWIPLQSILPVEQGGTPLIFADGSHLWTEEESRGEIQESALHIHSYGKLGIGDATAHHGWTMHAAPELEKFAENDDERWALALSYFVADSTRAGLPSHRWQGQEAAIAVETNSAGLGQAAVQNKDDEDEDEERESFQAWAADIPIGAKTCHELLPEVPVREGDLQVLSEQSHQSLLLQCAMSQSTTDDKNWRMMKYQALLLQSWERLEESEQLWSKVHEQQKTELGAICPAILDSARIRGELLRDIGKLDMAEALLRRSISVSHQHFGSSHLSTLRLAAALASICEVQDGRTEEAELLREAVLEGFREVLGDQHPDTQDAERDFFELLALNRTRTRASAQATEACTLRVTTSCHRMGSNRKRNQRNQ